MQFDIGIANELLDKNNNELSSNMSMLSAKEVHLRKIPNLVSRIVGIVLVSMKRNRNHVQRLARNVFVTESPIISKKFAVLNMMTGVQAFEIVDLTHGTQFLDLSFKGLYYM